MSYVRTDQHRAAVSARHKGSTRGSIADRFWGKVDRRDDDECWPWLGAVEASGYGKLYSHRDAAGRSHFFKAHRLSWEISNGGAVPVDMSILHSCDNPPCVNPGHLRPGSLADNALDRAKRGRGADQRGERSGSAKLTEEQVRQIIAELQRLPRRSQAAIAADFGIKQAHVSRIMRRATWPHLWLE